MTTATKTKPQAADRELLRMAGVELRAVKEGESKKIVGYAAVFNKATDGALPGDMVEVVRPGAFTRTLKEGRDVLCTFNHNRDKLLGRTSSGTLKLKEDAKGLWFECTPPDTQEARDVMALIERGDVADCSFVFRIPPESRSTSQRYSFPKDGPAMREILDVDLFDVGPNTQGAYQDTTVSLRGIEELRAEFEQAKGAGSTVGRRRWLDVAQDEVG